MKKGISYLCEKCAKSAARYEARDQAHETNMLICEACYQRLKDKMTKS